MSGRESPRPCRRPACDGLLVEIEGGHRRCAWCGFTSVEADAPGALRISRVRFRPSSAEERRAGLLGYVDCTIGDRLHLGGITVRRRQVDARLILSFPTKRDRKGREHALVRPVDPGARAEIEQAILLAIAGELAP